MSLFDSMQDVLDKGMAAADKGVAVAKGAVSGLAVEQQRFAKEFVRMCKDAYDQGWHEANGGNLSYVLSPEEVSACRPYCYTTPGAWVDLSQPQTALSGRVLMVTASGKHFRNVSVDPSANCGLVEVSAVGDKWRVVWGMKDGGRPTSELELHLSCLGAQREMGLEPRVVYHAHPAHLMALTSLYPVDSRMLTSVLWKGIAEAVIAFPKGVTELPWMIPGTAELAAACAQALKESDAAVAVNHGVFCCQASFGDAFGLVHTMDKAAQVHLLARAANGGNPNFAQQISDEGLQGIRDRYSLS